MRNLKKVSGRLALWLRAVRAARWWLACARGALGAGVVESLSRDGRRRADVAGVDARVSVLGDLSCPIGPMEL